MNPDIEEIDISDKNPGEINHKTRGISSSSIQRKRKKQNVLTIDTTRSPPKLKKAWERKITWDDISKRMNLTPDDPAYANYDLEIEWLKTNMCSMHTSLYKNHRQSVPACHQSAHYIYLGLEILKQFRQTGFSIQHPKPESQEIFFQILMREAFYEKQRYLFLLSDMVLEKSHRHLYMCPSELEANANYENYLLLCITTGHENKGGVCQKLKSSDWKDTDGNDSEIIVGHYGFLSLQGNHVTMISTWVASSTFESSRGKEHDVHINRQLNTHTVTLDTFKKYANIIGLPIEERTKQKISKPLVKNAFDFIGAISQDDPSLQIHIKNALVKRDAEIFAEKIQPLIVVLINIKNLPLQIKGSNSSGTFGIEDVFHLPTPKFSEKSDQYEFDEDAFVVKKDDDRGGGKGKKRKTKKTKIKSYRNIHDGRRKRRSTHSRRNI